jgi:hypothetical protein
MVLILLLTCCKDGRNYENFFIKINQFNVNRLYVK